ncbi:MAG: phosphoglucomutase/phosphomannomutase family protein [Syntrophomonadaceae bacterium]|nr:phosphoglucomutase/phosphomannomutase family protein [Syntrophomonadaceae bacterium]
MSQIKFGTDGWRAIVADTFTFANVQRVTQAIANYVNQHDLGSKGVVVGYDNRFLADRFAATVTEVLLGNQIPVYLLPGGTPTPVTAFMIQHYQAAGAVMLTASHNPPEYNGIKFIPEYAGPALPALTDEIESYLHKILAETESKGVTRSKPEGGSGEAGEAGPALEGKISHRVRSLPLEKGRQAGNLKEVEPKAAYLEQLQSVVDVAGIRRRPLKVVVDPMYGCGIGYLDEFLRVLGCQVEAIHTHRDPLFGGIVPEPMGKWLADLQEAVIRSNADLGLATDGDADRFGVVDRKGRYISANQVLYLLLHYLLQTRKYRGPVARTVATTHMLDRIARRYSLEVEETAVGFKFIGQSLLERGALLGGEESGGLSIHGHVPEKDGILAAALVTEMVAVSGQDPVQLMETVAAQYGELISERIDIHTSLKDKQRILETLKDFYPAAVAGFPVIKRIAHDGVKLQLEGDNWLLIRASGTEPLFRLYVEAGNEKSMRSIQADARRLLGL